MATAMHSFVFAALLAACQAAPSQPATLKLQRSTSKLSGSGKSKNFYSAKISVGQPAQEFHVAFDLGGGTTVLPSASCTDAPCLERRRYDKWSSESAVDIQADGKFVLPDTPQVRERMKGRNKGTIGFMSADLGSGKAVGSFVRDRFCVGEGKDLDNDELCFPLALLVAYKMEDIPFGLEPYDGTVGLGLRGMSVSPEFNFLDAIVRGHTGMRPNNFGLHIGGDEGGEITFGYDVKQLTQPLKWVTVAEPEEGRWQVAISAIRIGNNTLHTCRDGECRAALDYGASLLTVPPQFAGSMEKAIEFEASPSGYGDGCQITEMPELQIVLKNNLILTLAPEDYLSQVNPAQSKGILSGPSSSCKPVLSHHDFDVAAVGKDMFILGESVLRRYYTFFDGDSLQIGFGLATGASKGKTKALPPILEAQKAKKWLTELDDEEDGQFDNGEKGVILLVQVKIRRSKTISSFGL